MRSLRWVVRIFAFLGLGGAILLVGWVMLVGRMRYVYEREGGITKGGWWKL